MSQDQTQRDKLHDDADGEQTSDRMPLSAHGVHLQRDEHCVDQDEDEVHLERVLLVVGELEGEWDERRLVGIAVHQPEVVLYVRYTGHVEALRVKVLPLTGRGVAVARDQGHVPESEGE